MRIFCWGSVRQPTGRGIQTGRVVFGKGPKQVGKDSPWMLVSASARVRSFGFGHRANEAACIHSQVSAWQVGLSKAEVVKA